MKSPKSRARASVESGPHLHGSSWRCSLCLLSLLSGRGGLAGRIHGEGISSARVRALCIRDAGRASSPVLPEYESSEIAGVEIYVRGWWQREREEIGREEGRARVLQAAREAQMDGLRRAQRLLM